jgi:hypothetical protein
MSFIVEDAGALTPLVSGSDRRSATSSSSITAGSREQLQLHHHLLPTGMTPNPQG